MRLSIPGKVFAAFIALSLTFGAVIGLGLWHIRQQGVAVRGLHHSLVPVPRLVAELTGELRGLDLVFDQTDRATLRRSVHLARRVQPPVPRAQAGLARISDGLAAPGAPPAARALVDRVHLLSLAVAEFEPVATSFYDAVETDAEAGRLETARREGRRQLRALIRDASALDAALEDALGNTVAALTRSEQRASWAVLVLVAVALVVGVGVTVATARLLRPLRTLRAGVERVARGEYDAPVTAVGTGEIGELAQAFNRMAEALRSRDDMLVAQQKELLHQERLATVGHLSAQITHELRNPLTSIGLNSELLMEELELASEPEHRQSARNLLENIIREVERLREITEEYLGFARLPRPERAAVDLNLVASELVEFVRSEMERAAVRIRFDPDPGARPAWVDPNQIRAALLNLVRNAREAMPQGGHVVVRVRTLGDTATLAVIDDGPGFEPEALEHLFEPFFSTKPQGTGLGLPMVRKIVQAQAGDVRVERALPRGTAVTLALPLAPASAAFIEALDGDELPPRPLTSTTPPSIVDRAAPPVVGDRAAQASLVDRTAPPTLVDRASEEPA